MSSILALRTAVLIFIFTIGISTTWAANNNPHNHHAYHGQSIFDKGWSREKSFDYVEKVYLEKFATKEEKKQQLSINQDSESGQKRTKWYRNWKKKDLMEMALRAGPPHLTKDAAIMIPTKDMVYVQVREGTNGFICISKANFLIPMWDPACSDPAGHEWLMSLQAEDPYPSNTIPGVTYMFVGAGHWELEDGVITPGPGPNAILRPDPPHWMLLYPFNADVSGFPQYPNPGGVNLIYSGTPYSNLVFTRDTLCFSGLAWVDCNPPRVSEP